MFKRMIALASSLLLLVTLALGAAAQEATKEKAKDKAKSEARKAAMPTDDAGIQKCITDKLAASASLKEQSITVAVSNGEVTLTGAVKTVGSKGAATRIAKNCGAKKVANNLTAPPAPKKAPASGETKKP
jgi:osmotically-inducible protein OsmY